MHADAHTGRRNIGAVIDQDLRFAPSRNFSNPLSQRKQLTTLKVALAQLHQINACSRSLFNKLRDSVERSFIRFV